jgi:hypothetical protein
MMNEMKICQCGHGFTRHYQDSKGNLYCKGRSNLDGYCECLLENVNGYMGMSLYKITPNEEIRSGACECLHSSWDHMPHTPEAINDAPSHCRKCDCQTYKQPQWRCAHCGESSDVWRGNKEKNQWLCSDCWKSLPTSNKKKITWLRKQRRFGNKLELARDIDLAIMKVISMVIGNLELPELSYNKEDINSSDAKAHMLTLIRALGNTRELTGFDENMNALGYMVRALQGIIDDFSRSYGKHEDIFKP